MCIRTSPTSDELLHPFPVVALCRKFRFITSFLTSRRLFEPLIVMRLISQILSGKNKIQFSSPEKKCISYNFGTYENDVTLVTGWSNMIFHATMKAINFMDCFNGAQRK